MDARNRRVLYDNAKYKLKTIMAANVLFKLVRTSVATLNFEKNNLKIAFIDLSKPHTNLLPVLYSSFSI